MTKRRFVFIVLLSLLVTSVAGRLAAQTKETQEYSIKELRQKQREERKKIKRERKGRYYKDSDPVEKEPPAPLKKKYTVDYPQSITKSRYRIDVLMPMYLDDLVKGNAVTYKDRIPDKAQPGMSFYEGINIAADSLKKAGFKIDIYIHDIASASATPALLVSDGKLDSTDLIIGAVPVKDIPVLADFASAKQVNFVSALSASDAGVGDNPFFTMIHPSLKTHCEWIANEVRTKHAGQKVIMLYRRSAELDSLAWIYFTGAEGMDKADIKRRLCTTMPSKDKLLTAVDTGKVNVVVIPILDMSYADSILRMLSSSFPDTRFEVYGMPTWNGAVAVNKKRPLKNFSIHVTIPFNFDLSSPSAKYVARIYKKDYGTKPAELVYRGYETMFWYANLLKRYGTVFNERYGDNTTAPFTKFEVKPRWDNDGNILYHENTHLYISTDGRIN